MSLAALIAAQRVEHGIPCAVSCRALAVSQAWFHKWRKGDRSPRRKRRAALAATIAYLFTRHNGTYGSPRITADLRVLGWRVSVNTVATLMDEQEAPKALTAAQPNDVMLPSETAQERLTKYQQLASVDPRAAILLPFTDLEGLVRQRFQQLYPDENPTLGFNRMVEKLHSDELLSADIANALKDLRGISGLLM